MLHVRLSYACVLKYLHVLTYANRTVIVVMCVHVYGKVPSLLWRCWLCGRKSIRHVYK